MARSACRGEANEPASLFLSPAPLRLRRGETWLQEEISYEVMLKSPLPHSRAKPFLHGELLGYNKRPTMRSPIETARKLRQQMTPQEKLLWRHLRAHRFKGYKFRRQHPIGYQVIEQRTSFYVADFYCHSERIVIELDGKHHEFPDEQLYDMARDKLMTEFGMKILRIRNHELENFNDY